MNTDAGHSGYQLLLGALISPYGPPDAIYRAWRSARFELITSTTQRDDVRRASRYPKLKAILPPHRVGTMINHMRRAVVLESLPALPDDLDVNDPDDAFLLAMALAGEADYLVTGVGVPACYSVQTWAARVLSRLPVSVSKPCRRPFTARLRSAEVDCRKVGVALDLSRE